MGGSEHDGSHPVMGPDPTPPSAEIATLIDQLDALRTTLQTDLTLAAAALDAGATQVAHDLMSQDIDQVAAFEQSALGRLDALHTRQCA